MEAVREFTAQELEDIDDHAGALGRALKALDPATLPEDVRASLVRLRAAYARLNDAQDEESQAELALAEEADRLLCAAIAAPGDLLANLAPEAQGAAAGLRALFEPQYLKGGRHGSPEPHPRRTHRPLEHEGRHPEDLEVSGQGAPVHQGGEEGALSPGGG